MIQLFHFWVFIQNTWKDICTPMFTEAVFTLAKIGKQPKCPLMDERIKKDVTVIHTYNGILLSHKKEWYSAICNNMDGTWEHYAKWNKSDGERQISYMFTHVESKTKTKWTNKIKQKQKQTQT